MQQTRPGRGTDRARDQSGAGPAQRRTRQRAQHISCGRADRPAHRDLLEAPGDEIGDDGVDPGQRHRQAPATAKPPIRIVDGALPGGCESELLLETLDTEDRLSRIDRPDRLLDLRRAAAAFRATSGPRAPCSARPAAGTTRTAAARRRPETAPGRSRRHRRSSSSRRAVPRRSESAGRRLPSGQWRSRHLAIHDRHRRPSGRIVVGEDPAGLQRDAHRGEVAAADDLIAGSADAPARPHPAPCRRS